jgi:hypothetical protein
MLRTNATLWRLILTLALLLGTGAWAQNSGSSKPAAENTNDDKPAAQAAQKERSPLEAYRLEFSLNEMEDGRKINSRQYSTELATNESNEIKIGTRVPVETKDGEFQYLDIGTNIFARLEESRGQTELIVRAESSNFTTPEHDPRDMRPVIRQMKFGGSTLLPLTKTIVIGSADDPNSKRQFQLEVTVTKIK